MIATPLWGIGDWVEAIAALPAGGPLPCRTVLVPRERVAHSLRRELARAGHAGALAGTRFVPVAGAAAAVLRAAGVAFAPGEEALRPARLLALFRDPPPLRHFPARLLRDRPGWDRAFAAAIDDLEAAGLAPDTLDATGDPRLADIAAIWRAVDRLAGNSWTTARACVQAAAVLERRPAAWPFPGPVLAAATGHEGEADARFLRSIPGLVLGLLAARPLRERHLARVAALYGAGAAEVLARPAPRSGGSERDLLASYLFEPPHVLGDPDRPRSGGPDGTVRIEEYAGVEAEVEAAADWVAEQVAGGIPLEEIAVLVPSLDPLAGLVVERLGRLPWREGAVPVHVAGGLPLAGTAAGARVLAVVRALRDRLDGGSLADVLPALRTRDAERHLSRGAAMDLVWSLGATGGSPARPRGALEWAERLAAREPQVEARLARARAAADDSERPGVAREADDLEARLDDLRAVRPAIEALVGVARLVVDGAPLADLWPALRRFLADWLLQPGQGARVEHLLEEHLGPAARGATGAVLSGDDALRVVEDAIHAVRLPCARFGEPAVYVGTVAGAVGLRFSAIRIIGLAEGHLPPLAREDPVVPDTLRVRLAGRGAGGRAVTPATAGDRALEALHAFDLAVRSAARRLALSAPRLDLDRTQREPSSVILEAAAALGRPDGRTGERAPVVPDTTALRRDTFAPSRRAALAFRTAMPLGEAAWQDAVARGAAGIPPRWRGAQALDLDRMAALADDGLLGSAAADVAVPGLGPDWPISPSRLETLLRCPYLYLLHVLLGLDEPAGPPSLGEIGQPAYGSLFHAVAEEIFRAHGRALCAGQGTLDGWLAAAGPIADRLFDEFLEQYPLVGEAVRRAQRDRLHEGVLDLLRYELALGPRRFVATERVFGEPIPVELPLGGRSLFVRGKIDRVDADDRRTLVRDLKTGRVTPRVGAAAEPDPVEDVQIAVYGLVAGRLAGQWGTPAGVGVAYVGQRGDERSFVDDFHQVLAPAARDWLSIAAALLAERAFPRTPCPDDCDGCAFQPVCGDRFHARAREVLARGGPALRRFLDLKQPPEREED